MKKILSILVVILLSIAAHSQTWNVNKVLRVVKTGATYQLQYDSLGNGTWRTFPTIAQFQAYINANAPTLQAVVAAGNTTTRDIAINLNQNSLAGLSVTNGNAGVSASTSIKAATDMGIYLKAYGINTAKPGVVGVYSDDAYGAFEFGTPTGIPFKWTINGSEKMRLDGSGRLGIMNSSPNEVLTLGAAGTKGTLSLAGNTSGKVIIQPQAAAGTWTLTLPNTAGSNGQSLITDGSGNTSWSTITGGGASLSNYYIFNTIKSRYDSVFWFPNDSMLQAKAFKWDSAGSSKVTITRSTSPDSAVLFVYDIVPANILLQTLGGSLNVSQINATGTPSSSTYLRGDGTWSPAGGGTITGTLVANNVPYPTSSSVLARTGSGTLGLWWDAVNNRFSINQSSASYTLDVNGGINGSSLNTGGSLAVGNTISVSSVFSMSTATNPYFRFVNNWSSHGSFQFYGVDGTINLLDLDGTGNSVKFPTYTSAGDRIPYLDMNGKMGTSGLDPALVLQQSNVSTGLVYSSGIKSKSYSLVTNTTDVGNITTGEDDLITYSLPAGQLATNGDYVEGEMDFEFAINANSKTLRVYFGSDDIITDNTIAASGGSGIFKFKIVRTGATTQEISYTFVSTNNANVVNSSFSGTQTLSGAITIKATGDATATNDIIERSFNAKYFSN